VDARLPDKQLTADRSNFWKVVDRTKPSKLYIFSENELRDCQDYFLKAQSDPSAPGNELLTAAEQLTLIRSEIDRRHGDAKYRRTQRLAWWAIGLAGVSTTCAIGLGVAQFLTRQQSREHWPADMGTPSFTPALVMEMTTPTPEPTRQPSPTPDVTLAPVFTIEAPTSTPIAKATATARSRTKHRSRRQSTRKADSRGPVEKFFRSLFPARPTQTPSAARRR
jgi:hypothetical protein